MRSILKRFVSTGLLLLVAISASTSPSLAAHGFKAELLAGPASGPMKFSIFDSMGSDRTSLDMQPSGVQIGETRGDWVNCLDTLDPACNKDIEGFSGQSILSPCANETQVNCIESVAIGTTSSEPVKAELIREAETGFSIPADLNLSWIAGGSPSIWRSSTAHAGGSFDYSAVVKLGQYFNRKTQKFEVNFLQAALVPHVEDLSAEYSPFSVDRTLDPGNQIINARGGDGSCLWRELGKCGLPVAFAQGTVVEMVMRLPKEIGGWFQGRFKDPVMSIEDFASNTVQVSIRAEAIEVPYFKATRQIETLTPVENFWLQSNGSGFGNESAMGPGDPRVFDYVEHFRAEMSDQIAGKKTIWMLSTTFFSNGTSCYSDNKIQGIVSTNAMGFDSNAPAYDSGYLNYRVTGLHFEEDGVAPVLGTYDLLLDSDVARCMYGFNKAPISATVQVVGGASENIATTIVSEKDGWLKLAAYGFTFSEKEIQVKLSQPQSKTLTKFAGSTRSLSSKQKAEIKSVLSKAKGNTKFICTGIYSNAKDKTTAIKRARAACDYAKSLDKNFSFWSQAKQTKAASYNGKVLIVSK